jgi:hypothetical protein
MRNHRRARRGAGLRLDESVGKSGQNENGADSAFTEKGFVDSRTVPFQPGRS